MDIFEQEAAATTFLRQKNKGLFKDIVARAYDFMGEVLDRLSGPNPDGEVFAASTLTFVRLMQDLRWMHLCASRGYPTGAGTIAASIWELGYEIKYLIINPGKAEKWFDHDDIKHVGSKHRNRLDAVSIALIEDDAERRSFREIERKTYSFFCVLKHGNSTLQKHLGIKESQRDATISPNPDLSDFAVFALEKIIYHSCNYCILSAKFIANHYFTEEQREALTPTLEALSNDLRNRMDAALPKLPDNT